MTFSADCLDYNDIDTISERIEGLRKARAKALEDEDCGAMACPYPDQDDPRRFAYLAVRNEISSATRVCSEELP